ncbi:MULTISPECIES: hypothetical protein [Parachlamydia]|jgi:hypothetical protein|uniref:Uncharacterized protein n=2 Tax=Parachlamydia acanthamoebae TaxID=83552 RepID=F8KYP2_PARAV|nr:hypothetical protein [Parachlamydia acanthamoebae]EFB41139.1 hypothetical protein pah_c050o113 [Parachlamydia acanthamoebae str. Hall's coccus]KIA78296.1 hypothetical protein DB43_EI00410 [Parachlamydia acanthamoebae]CCB85997.1 putative uncharacterized protein [Parachlamydia acanthamoebae UV-7]
MLRDTTYKEKFAILKNWMPQIIEPLKKDLKNDHLKNDWEFFKRYFASKNFNKLTVEDFVSAYSQAIEEVEPERAEEIAEFIANRWLMRNAELYEFFEGKLNQINPNFQDIQELSPEQSKEILDDALNQFGSFRTYVFSILNSVVFPQIVYEDLRKKADQHIDQTLKQQELDKQERSLEAIKGFYEQQMARMQDKYEKKLSGMQKKYVHDVESLKKQISALQRKLGGQ